MKRYDIDAPAKDQYAESPDGEWVRFADVEEVRTRLAAATALLRQWGLAMVTPHVLFPTVETRTFLAGQRRVDS